MIDLHFHALPGIDDGPRTLADAIALARAAVDAGVSTVVATPHVTFDCLNRGADIAAAVTTLQSALREQRIDLELRAGAEIGVTMATELDDAELRALALGGGPWVLVEAPLTAVSAEPLFWNLLGRRLRIVLAHPERSPGFQHDPESLRRLVQAGVLTSITAGALVGRFGSDVRRFALQLAAEGLVHNISSDAHDLRRRPPGIAPQLERAGLSAQAQWLTEQVPRAILDGTPLPPRPPGQRRPAPRSLRRRLLRRD